MNRGSTKDRVIDAASNLLALGGVIVMCIPVLGFLLESTFGAGHIAMLAIGLVLIGAAFYLRPDPSFRKGSTRKYLGVCLAVACVSTLLVVSIAGINAFVARTSPHESPLVGGGLRLRAEDGRTSFVLVGTSLNGHWASPTWLDMVGDYHIRGLVPPRARAWGDAISHSSSGAYDKFRIQGSFTVPIRSTSITGRIVGDVEVPVRSGNGYVISLIKVDVPIVVELR
jgi:uncharacterized membrane protein YidH (DUF202 family)